MLGLIFILENICYLGYF